MNIKAETKLSPSILSGIDQVKISNHELEKNICQRRFKTIKRNFPNLDTQTVRVV